MKAKQDKSNEAQSGQLRQAGVSGSAFSRSMANERTRCGHCGKFMSYDEPSHTEYTPDSAYSVEELYVVHLHCR
jgi:hypothetical protein